MDHLHLQGYEREAWGGDHDATAVSAVGGAQDQIRQPDGVEYLVAACQGVERGEVTGQDLPGFREIPVQIGGAGDGVGAG